MKTLIINNIITEKTLVQSGNLLFDEINKSMNANEKLVLDMNGVSSLPSIFMNMSFGQFIDNYGLEKLLSTIQIINITKSQAERISNYFKRYKS